MAVGGYDAEPDTVGSGSRDIDLKDRVLMLGGALQSITRGLIGGSIPNHEE